MQKEPGKQSVFSSKWAMILTCMGMAVGTGNIWRFPREVAANGGGSFLIPWFIFLFLWSVPLLMVELSTGQHMRKGPFGAFTRLLGKNFAWMGGFITICAMLIMCYYAVVTGWTLRYFLYAIMGELNTLTNDEAIALFDNFRNTPMALLFHWLAVGLAAFFVFRGTKGIEGINKILIPSLVLILIIGAVSALTMEGSGKGLGYLFSVDTALLTDPKHWIAGLTQSAWSTGAGWGLMLTYAVYARHNEDPVSTPMATGAGNNSIEVLVALMIFPALFAIMGTAAVDYVSGTSSKGGIAFQVIPMIFRDMDGTAFFNVIFFFGLASAALTSLIAMVELSSRFFVDLGLSKKHAMLVTILLAAVLGTPSALSDTFFDNQDFVWGVGLILSGLFLAFMVLRVGPMNFANRYINDNATFLRAGSWFTAIMWLVLLEGLVLLAWWFWTAGIKFQIMFLIQWGVVILALFLCRNVLAKRMFPEGIPPAHDA